MMRHLLFSVDHTQCAIPLDTVRIVLQMVQLGPAPDSRPGLAGTVNLHGQIIPVWSVRSILGSAERSPRLTDRLIIAGTTPACAALWVDEAHVTQQNPVLPQQTEIPEKGGEVVAGITRTDEGVFIITDLRQFLSPENSASLKAAAADTGDGREARHA